MTEETGRHEQPVIEDLENDVEPVRIRLTPGMLEALMHSTRLIRPHVVLEGLNKTHPSVVSRDVRSVERCGTMAELVDTLEASRTRWLRSGIFTDFQYNFEPAADGAADDVVVAVQLSEVPTSHEIGVFTTNAAVPELKANLVNLFGRGYSLTAQYTPPAGSTHAWSFKAVSLTPLLGHRLEISLGQEKEAYAFHPADSEHIEEAKVSIDFHTSLSQHTFSVGVDRRDLRAAESYGMPQVVTQDFGTSVKTFARHEWRYSNTLTHSHPRLNAMYPLPIVGLDCHVINEVCARVASLGDVSHVRHEFQAMQYIFLHPLLILDVGVRVGGIWGFGSDAARRRVRLNDRLFLGWRHVRGHRTVGPTTVSPEFHSGGSESEVVRLAAVGGNALWALSASLNFPLPILPENGFLSTHLFANCGNVGLFDKVTDFTAKARSWLLNPAISVGAGLVISKVPLFGLLPNGRLEVNASLPISRSDSGKWSVPDLSENVFDRVKFGLVWSSATTY